MLRVLAALTAELAELEPRCRLLLVLVSDVIAMFAITTLQRDVISRHNLFLVRHSGQWSVASGQFDSVFL